MDEILPPMDSEFGSPPAPRLRVVNGGSSSSSSANSPDSEDSDFKAILEFQSHSLQFIDLEKKLKVSAALKNVPEVRSDSESVHSRDVVVVMPDYETVCSTGCPLIAKVEMLEAQLLSMKMELDESRVVVQEIRRLMVL